MRRGLDLSIGQRLGVGFAILAVALVGVMASTMYWNARSGAAEQEFTLRITPRTQATDELEGSLMRVAIAVRSYLIAPGRERQQRVEDSVENARTALRRLGELPKDADGDALLGSATPRVERYLTQAVEVMRANPKGEEAARAESVLAESREAAMAALQSYVELQRRKAGAALKAIEEAREAGSQWLVSAALLALLLFAVSAILTARSIRRPTRELLRVAGALQRGDWRPALAWAPKEGRTPAVRDEMLRLAYAFGAAAAALESREQRLRADREIAGAAASSLAKEGVAEAALRAVCDHVNAEVGAFYWVDDHSEVLRPIALRALDGGAASLAVGEGIPGRAARELRTVVAADIPWDSPFNIKLGIDAAPPRTVVAVPVQFQGALLGVMLVGSLRKLAQPSISFLEEACAQLSVGLQNVKTYERVQQLLAELGEKNQQIQAQNEELQAQNEEIQAQNEELQAQGEEIQAQNEQLKHQADALRTHAGSLAEQDRRKSEFLGVLAHELRNPMAAISNSLYALVNAAGNAEQRDRAQDIIRRQTQFLGRLVDDLLDVTRISNGKVRLQKEPLDFAEVVRECAGDYREAAQRANVKLDIALPPGRVPVYGDRTRLCQIIGNLVDNAVKFVNGGREVTVSLRTSNGHAELRVRDRGVGIEPEMLGRLFQPFSQADTSLARRKAGLGLGLALAKALVELHDGTIEARSEGAGKGAEFIVRLPLSAAAPAQAVPGPIAQPRATGRGRRVLIIEDNPDAALSLRDAMELAGHEVRVAYDSVEGLEIARQFCPEVLLCDIGLPTMDGYQVARSFRSDERLRSTYMIAVTGYAGEEDRERALRSGFDRHLGKPPDIELLNQLLSEVNKS